MRFIFPMLPLVCALAGVGLEEVRRRFPGPPAGAVAAALAATLALSAATHRNLTFGQVGQHEHTRPHDSAYDDKGIVNRLLLAASALPDLCGLKVEAAYLSWTGGHTYLHRNVPLYPPETPRKHPGLNYVIGEAGSGGEVVAQEGNLALLRIREGCKPDPSYSWRLP
jgi:hypothetical protein